MCILLKLDYAKFGVSNEEKPLEWGGGAEGRSARPYPCKINKPDHFSPISVTSIHKTDSF